MSGIPATINADVGDGQTVVSSMTFLKRDKLWAHEKPYRLRYTTVGDLPRSNFLLEESTVTVRDMRPSLDMLSVDKNGFQVNSLSTTLLYDDFFDYNKVSTVYKKEAQNLVRDIFSAKHVHALDYELRRRHETFPVATGQKYSYGQPNMIAHIDVTIESLKNIVSELYGKLAEKILESRIQCVTLWKPLRGKVADWPLALCDSRSLHNDDVINSDAVYQRVVAENCMIHYNSRQEWYYLAGQDHTEALVFKAADSDESCPARCAHGSFHLPGSIDPPPRESIDMRLLVMYADVDYPEDVEWHT